MGGGTVVSGGQVSGGRVSAVVAAAFRLFAEEAEAHADRPGGAGGRAGAAAGAQAQHKSAAASSMRRTAVCFIMSPVESDSFTILQAAGNVNMRRYFGQEDLVIVDKIWRN